MNKNIGILSTPNNIGGSIKVNENKIEIDKPIYLNSIDLNLNTTHSLLYGNRNAEIRILANMPDSNSEINASGLFLYGADTSSLSGEFRLRAYNKDTNYTYDLIGRTNGNLLFNGCNVESVYASGDNYIQYNNGLLIQWNKGGSATSHYGTISFSIPFIDTDYSIACTVREAIVITSTTNAQTYTVNIYKNLSNFIWITTKNNINQSNVGFTWIAIGKWK